MSARGQTVTVLGAGLGGALMAIYLARLGYEVAVYEMRPDPRAESLSGGRSINLAISTRGLDALARVGLAETVLSMAVPMRGRVMHSQTGSLTFQPYGTRQSQVINSVSRNGLNVVLLEAAAQQANVRLFFGKKCTDVDLESGKISLVDVETSEAVTVDSGRIVGADGAYSVCRRQMYRVDRFNYQQSYLEHGYKELTIPVAPGGGFALQANALHIWPRGGLMMIALPNADGSFTCTLFWPLEGPNSFAAVRTGEDVLEFFRRTFPDAVPLMPSLMEDYVQNPTSSLVTVRCSPWHYGDRLVLLGDAGHAVVPFYGQGANAAFEDCVVLNESLRAHAPQWETAFRAFEAARRPHTDVLADLAIENFLEMRDRVASRAFLATKKLEKALHRMFPEWFVPLYTMVTFTRMPYAEAVQRDRRQWRVVRGVGIALIFMLSGLLVLLATG